MELQGRIIQIMPLASGVSKSGNQWQKQEFVIETPGQYPKKVCLQLFGDKVAQYPIAVGQDIVAHIDIDSREFNGRWYSTISVWKIEAPGSTSSSNAPVQTPPTPEPEPEKSNDDLPF